MAIETVKYVYEADTKQFVQSVGDAKKSTSGFADAMTGAGSKLEGFAKKTKYFSAAAAAAGGFAIKAAMDFESAFAGVEKTVNGTEAQIASLRQGIRDMALELPAGTTEIAAVAEAAGQLGIETDNILGFTKVMIDMGEATNLSADEAATALARFANVTKMSQADFDRAGSAIVDLGNNFATTEADIVSMAMRLGAAGTQVGLTQPEIFALSTALSSVGLSAEAGGTAISKLMVNMQVAVESGGKDLQAFADVAGMTASDFAQAFGKDAAGALIAFTDGLNDTERNGKSAIGVLNDMGIKEVRLRDAILRTSGATELFNDALGVSNNAWDENIALAKEAETRYATTESQMAMLKNVANEVGITFGEIMLPKLLQVMEVVRNGLLWFSNLSGGMQEVIVIIVAMVAAMSPVAKIVGMTMKAFGLLSTALGAVTAPVIAIIAGVAALIAIFVLMYKHSEEFREAVDNLVGTALTALQTIFETVILPLLQAAWEAFQALLPPIMELGAAIGSVLIPIFQAIIIVVEIWINILVTLWQWVAKIIIIFMDTFNVVGILKGGINLITGAVNILATGIGWLWGKFTTLLRVLRDSGPIGVVTLAFDKMGQGVQWVIDKVASLINWFTSLGSKARAIGDSIGGFFNKINPFNSSMDFASFGPDPFAMAGNVGFGGPGGGGGPVNNTYNTFNVTQSGQLDRSSIRLLKGRVNNI